MSDEQEASSVVLERYRKGRNEVAYTVQFAGGPAF